MHLLQPSSEGAFRAVCPPPIGVPRAENEWPRAGFGRTARLLPPGGPPPCPQHATTRGTPTWSSMNYHQGDPHPVLNTLPPGGPHPVLNTLPPGGPHLVLNRLPPGGPPPGGPPSGPQPASRTATTRGTPTWSSMCYHQGDPHLVLSGPADPSTVDQLNPGSSVQRQYFS
ncbi:unnamed protein product [Boreogadus saida]